MSKGLRLMCELLLGLALAFFYFAMMTIAPKSAFVEPFFQNYMIVLYFGIPMFIFVPMFVYTRFKMYAAASLAAVVTLYFMM